MNFKSALSGIATATIIGGLGMAAPSVAADKIVQIDGSSTVYPITEAVAEDFQKAHKDVKVTVGISGTGGGFKKFCRGETDVSDASRPISKKEMDACKEAGIKYIELPVAFDALTVVVNKKNDWLKSITVDELKKMWEPAAQEKIVKWSDVNPKWPNEKLVLFGPGADSGTFDYFTDAINGKEKASRGDFTASEDDNVLVQGVSPGAFFNGATSLVSLPDLLVGLFKAGVFGFVAASVACYRGMTCEMGPVGVGRGVTQSVVQTFIAVFALNYVITALYLTIFPPSI